MAEGRSSAATRSARMDNASKRMAAAAAAANRPVATRRCFERRTSSSYRRLGHRAFALRFSAGPTAFRVTGSIYRHVGAKKASGDQEPKVDWDARRSAAALRMARRVHRAALPRRRRAAPAKRN
jgi:hypothetical protein